MSMLEQNIPVPGKASQPADAAPRAAASTPEPVAGELSLMDLARAMHVNGWRWWHPLLAGLLVAAGVWLLWDGWADLVWLAVHDAESSQVMVVPVVAAWLLWIRRHRLAKITPGFSLLGPAMVALAWIAWDYSYYDNVRAASHLAAVLAAAGAVVAVFGRGVFWRLLPVFGVLLFAIPVPHSIRVPISVPLQQITARITEHLMLLFGAEVTRQGSVLSIHGVDVGVAEACNGMRSVFALFLVSYLVVFSSRINPWLRLAILALAPVFALLCNIARLVPTVYLYGHASKGLAKTFHDFSGWFTYGLAFLMVLGTLYLIRWMLAPPEASPPEAPGDASDQ